MPVLGYNDVVILSGASQSSAITAGNYHILGIVVPSSWTAANLTFLVSADGTTYVPVHDINGTEVTATAAASRYIALTGSAIDALDSTPYLKIRSGTTATPVNQGADRTLRVVVGPRP